MSQENVEIVLGQFQGVNARDPKAVMDAFADDVVVALHGELRGIGEVRLERRLSRSGSGDTSGCSTPASALRSRSRATVETACSSSRRTTAGGGPAGSPVTRRMAYVYTVREGKVSRMEVWGDREEALEAAGLRD